MHPGSSTGDAVTAARFSLTIDGVEIGGISAAVGVNAPTPRRTVFSINRDNNALRPEVSRCVRNELGILYGSRVYAHLIGTRQEHCAKIFNRANPASDRQRHEALLCSPRDDIHHDGAVVA